MQFNNPNPKVKLGAINATAKLAQPDDDTDTSHVSAMLKGRKKKQKGMPNMNSPMKGM